MFNRIFFVLIIVLSAHIGFSQHRCGMDEYTDYHSRIASSRLSAVQADTFTEVYPVTGVIKIPVVVHIIHSNALGQIGGANISDDQIHSQIRVLNEDFRRTLNTNGYNNDAAGADTEIEFCLATKDEWGADHTGINRIYNSQTTWSLNDGPRMKALSYWPSDQYLNIWVANIYGALGYSQFPDIPTMPGLEPPYDAQTDGLAIDYRNFGTTGPVTSPYNYGRTVTHETGHWLGLLHIWGKNYCGDDFISDTPQDAAATKRGICIDSSNCTGIYTRDMTNNYMDYTDDACMNIFTKGQKERMRSVFKLNKRRNALLNSKGCSPIDGITEGKIAIASIFPNPAEETVTFKLPVSTTARVEFVDELNVVVKIIDLTADNFTTNVSDLKPGFYLVNIETQQGKYISRLVKL